MHIKEAQLYQEIIGNAAEYFAARAKPSNVLKYSRFFREGYDAWGNDVSEIKTMVAQIQSAYPDLSVSQLLELGNLLFQHGKYEMGNLAIMLLETRLKDSDKACFEGLKMWFDFGVGNWAHADYLCSRITPWFLQQQIVGLPELRPWLSSASRWTRRAAAVSLIKVKRQEKVEDLLCFIEPLLTDPERVVHQGTGWLLRELWKVHPQKVEDFLYLHRNTAARLIIQYATEKLSKEERLRFRRDKKGKIA
ncbi:MAG: hypothetical protein PWP64_391 [Candidatus Cloacimonadota bacterium]|nr:hypothetical protein [Candidatus Cloacimonadota bacterium]